ncbi:MAG TPA: sigma-54 dependent transcriptional regulator [bacterium]
MINVDRINILLIEDEEYDVRRIRNTIAPFASRIKIKDVVSDGQSALALIEKQRDFDVVIMDFQIVGGLKGEALIRRIKHLDETLQIIVVTKMTMNLSDFEFANKLLEAGAMWYCTKYPGDIEEYIYQPTDFVLSIFNAYEKRKLQRERIKSTRRLQDTIAEMLSQKQIMGDSLAMQKLREQIGQCAQSNATVLILGSSGTGKELVASHIHYQSERRFENFVPINCGSLPDNLIESELFGFEKGSFTGADAKKKGLFELADKGTIFLDEVSELPLSAQSKLLRVLQEGEIDKIGRTEKLKVDVRMIAASNRDLHQEVKEKRFREDLYYRLSVVGLSVPPLRERREDIPVLISYYLRHYSADMNRVVPEVSEEALTILSDYDWPGNVREVQNVVQRFLFAATTAVDARLAKLALGMPEAGSRSDGFMNAVFDKDKIRSWREMEQIFQERYFRFVREHTRSDAEAARLLGLAPPNYLRMCKRLGLK